MEIVNLLTREMADEPVPELDWASIERDLFARIEKPAIAVAVVAIEPELRPRTVARVSSWREGLGVALAAAAMVALAVGGERSAERATQAPATAEVSGAADIERVVEGVATWKLTPGSRARIVASPHTEGGARSMTVSLLQGSVHAEVVHRDFGESFAVEVGKTRIAAHGTSFDVTREGDRVEVSVLHGSVAIGPSGHPGSTQGWLLVGPARASFSIDGARDAKFLPAEEPSTAVAAAPQEKAAPLPKAHAMPPSAAKKAGPVREVPLVPTAASPIAPTADSAPTSAMSTTDVVAAAPPAVASDQPAAGPYSVVAAITTGLERCYRHQLSAAGVEFSIESSLRLTIAPDGRVREGRFDPPLSPTLMSCASEALGKARFAPGAQTLRLEVPIRLSPARVSPVRP